MKIIAGKLKNRNFFMPSGIKPTQGLIRKVIFDLIGQDLSGMHFLDLFAGSGSVGFEALSRGAQKVTFVEKDLRCYQVITENLRILGGHEEASLAPVCEILNMDAFVSIKFFHKQQQKFDFIYIDPPYHQALIKKILKTLGSYDIMKPDSLIIVEHGKREGILENFDERFSIIRHRKYGVSHLAIYKRL